MGEAENRAEYTEQAPDHHVEAPLEAVTQLGTMCAPGVPGLSLADLGYGVCAGKGVPTGDDMPQHNTAREEKIRQGMLRNDSENDWAYEMRKFWSFGEQGGLARLED